MVYLVQLDFLDVEVDKVFDQEQGQGLVIRIEEELYIDGLIVQWVEEKASQKLQLGAVWDHLHDLTHVVIDTLLPIQDLFVRVLQRLLILDIAPLKLHILALEAFMLGCFR